jgi:AcrR family transcriptional regulator
MLAPDPPRRGRPALVDRDSVLSAVVKLLRHEGPSGVTIRGVADAVGVSRQVVYTQFGSLGGLVDALYRAGFDGLRAAAEALPPSGPGVAAVLQHATAYRSYALDNPELYQVMFERPFRSYSPPPESREAALAAFAPLVASVASTGRTHAAARDLAITLWGALHGLVHLELQGYFAFEASPEHRVARLVEGVLADAS